MKILISSDGPHAHYHIRMSWARVFQYMGHDVELWDKDGVPAYDVFDEYEPDLFMGQTYNLDRSVFQCIKERPDLKVVMRGSDWGDMQKEIDLEKYPILVASEKEKKLLEKLKKETGKPDFIHNHYTDKWMKVTPNKWSDIGIRPVSLIQAGAVFQYGITDPSPLLRCDVGFIGGYWPYKAQNLDKYLIRLCHPVGKFKIKIFGSSDWPVMQYMGRISPQNAPSLFRSAVVSPNISEPHSQDFGYDIIERPFKVLMSGGFCISDYVKSMADEIFTNEEVIFAKTPKDFEKLVDYYTRHPEEREGHIEAGFKCVMSKHTYFHRVAKIFSELGMEEESKKCLAKLKEYIGE